MDLSSQNKLQKSRAVAEFWRRGLLFWKLTPSQKELYDLFYNSKQKLNVWLCGRRFGKGYSLSVLAIEQCVRVPNSIVKIVSPTKMQVDNNIRPLFKKILEDCPSSLRPDFRVKEYIYYFPNGSEIHLAGTDNGHAEKLRGSDCHLAIIDEAGSCADIKNIVNNILLPTTLVTKGKIILASTPPGELDHEFLKFIEKAELNGTLIKKPTTDNPLVSAEEMQLLIDELGGVHSDSYKREILCEVTKDLTISVIPEFDELLEKEIVRDHKRPSFYDNYISMDLGFKDLTIALFGYYDFRQGKLIIEDELEWNFQNQERTIPKFVKAFQTKEKLLFTNVQTNELRKPYMRVSDINYIVTQEIARVSRENDPLHPVDFTTPKKDDKEAAINNLRVMLMSRKIIISPRCTTLIRHLKNCRWRSASDRKQFARSPDNGHYDAVDALIYLTRSVNYTRNPYPSYYDYEQVDLHVENPKAFQSRNIDVFKKVFNVQRPTLPIRKI